MIGVEQASLIVFERLMLQLSAPWAFRRPCPKQSISRLSVWWWLPLSRTASTRVFPMKQYVDRLHTNEEKASYHEYREALQFR